MIDLLVFTSSGLHIGTSVPRFRRDPEKPRRNLNKHDVTFEDAELVWSDPLLLVRCDRIEEAEERWHALGLAGGLVLLLLVHTYPEADEAVVRIVSSRKATTGERRAYEDGDF